MAQSRKGQTRTTTQRGLGHPHQKRRAQLLPHAIGTRCPIGLPGCDVLMVDPKRMDLDHSVPRALGGRHGDRIVCRHCNRSMGARLGNQLRGARRRGTATPTSTQPVRSRRW